MYFQLKNILKNNYFNFKHFHHLNARYYVMFIFACQWYENVMMRC